jgi:hypothetical protein
VQRSLPEMNQAIIEKSLPFRAYAFHRGGENPKAKKIIAGKDAKGHAWALTFVWSSPEFEKQIGGVRGLPSYYVMDKTGRVRAVIKGHSKDTLETLKWLITEMDKQS